MKLQLLRKVNPPLSKEVWYVSSKTIEMQSTREHEIEKRPVLILQNKTLCKAPCEYVSVVPLSTAGTPDNYRFPIENNFIDIQNGFTPSLNSHALLRLYQPINLEFFIHICAKITDEAYGAIEYSLCTNVIGYNDFDLSI